MKAKLIPAMLIGLSSLLLTACGGMATMESLKGGGLAIIEAKSVERQLNRTALASAVIRTNASILYDMPLSENSEWVDRISEDLDDAWKRRTEAHMKQNDAFFATQQYTNGALAGLDDQGGLQHLIGTLIGVTPIDFVVQKRLETLYNKRPDIYAIPTTLKDYSSFPDVRLIKVKATSGNAYPNVERAVLALLPDGFQQDLLAARTENKQAERQVGRAKGKLGEVQSKMKSLKNQRSSNPRWVKLNQSQQVLKQEISDLEAIAKEKQAIYFKLLDQGSEALQNDFDDSKLALALKLRKALDSIYDGASAAGIIYTTALAKLYQSYDILPKELAAIAGGKVGSHIGNDPKLSRFIDVRVDRLKNNAINLFPSLGIGAYQAVMQSVDAAKYAEVVETYLELYEAQHGRLATHQQSTVSQTL